MHLVYFKPLYCLGGDWYGFLIIVACRGCCGICLACCGLVCYVASQVGASLTVWNMFN